LKYNKKKNCAFIFYGDGAANQGQVFESFNMASLWQLPAVYICEDNRYGMGTPVERSSATPDYYKRGAPFIPGIRVDGMNVFAVREAARYAKEWAIHKGPIIIHAETYRYYGHSMSDPGVTYRTREEIKKMRTEKDPITKMQKELYEKNIVSEEELKQIDKEVKQEVEEAVEFADQAQEPPDDELTKDVYADKEYKVKGISADIMYHVKQ
jgi:pyruvate dehydrogenase E1 component alpha subunit